MLNRIAHAIPLCLEIAEVEEFVLLDRSSNTSAVLFQFHRRLDALKWISCTNRLARYIGVEVITRIESIAAAIRVGRSVDRICAGFDSYVDGCAGLPAVFRARILLGLEFIDGVNGEH